MKELITEEQANTLILVLSIALALGSLGFGFYRRAKIQKQKRRLWGVQTAIGTLVGPAVWAFWEVYNSIENYYGLDSLKALGINFLIAIGLGALFFTLFWLAPRWAGTPKPAPTRK